MIQLIHTLAGSPDFVKGVRNCENAMVFVPAPGTIKAELVYNQEGSVTENVLNYDVGTSVPTEWLTLLAAGLKTTWDTYIKSQMTNYIQLIKIRCTSLDSQDAPGIEYVTGMPITGTSATNPVPANVAAEIIYYTDLRGRSNRGRSYVPGWPEGNTDGSALTTAFQTALLAGWEHFMHITNGDLEADLTVVSRFHNGAPRNEAVTNAVTTMTCAKYVVSQRRRLPGRGA